MNFKLFFESIDRNKIANQCFVNFLLNSKLKNEIIQSIKTILNVSNIKNDLSNYTSFLSIFVSYFMNGKFGGSPLREINVDNLKEYFYYANLYLNNLIEICTKLSNSKNPIILNYKLDNHIKFYKKIKSYYNSIKSLYASINRSDFNEKVMNFTMKYGDSLLIQCLTEKEIIKQEVPDWRPSETVPEDYYAL